MPTLKTFIAVFAYYQAFQKRLTNDLEITAIVSNADPNNPVVIGGGGDSPTIWPVPLDGEGFSLEYTVGAAGAPAAGDSTFTLPETVVGNIKFFREGERQSHSLVHGFMYDVDTRVISFYPDLENGERLIMEASGESDGEVDPPVGPEMSDLTFLYLPGNQSLYDTDLDKIWEGSGHTSSYVSYWRVYAEADQNTVFLPATDFYVQFKYESTLAEKAVLGFSPLNVGGGYVFDGDYEACAFIDAGGVVKVIDQDVESSQGTIAIGEWLRVSRIGGVYKCEKSADQITWVELYTFTYAFTGQVYVRAALDLYNYTDGSFSTGKKLFFPQYRILT